MARELICPTCGQPVLVGSRDELPAANVPLSAAQTIEVVIPGTASHDGADDPEITLASPVPSPDPAHGAFVCGDPAAAFALGGSGSNGSGSGSGSASHGESSAPAPAADPPPFDAHAELLEPLAAFGVPADALGAANAAPASAHPAEPARDLQADMLSVLNFDNAPEPRLSTSSHEQPTLDTSAGPSDKPAAASDVEFEYDTSRPGLAMIVLTSYASALTLAFIFIFATGRVHMQRDSAPATIAADSRPDLGQPGARGAARVAVEPIDADHVTSLGKPLRLGSLEVTPIAVRTGSVKLERVAEDGSREERDAGADTLQLRLKLRNASDREVFAPLEAAFVREHDRGLPDSFVEVNKNERIDIYPLAVYSEWAVVGQSFAPLAAGEEREIDIVSAPDALGRVGASGGQPLTWRVRLRTGPDETELLGVRFAAGDIQPGGR